MGSCGSTSGTSTAGRAQSQLPVQLPQALQRWLPLCFVLCGLMNFRALHLLDLGATSSRTELGFILNSFWSSPASLSLGASLCCTAGTPHPTPQWLLSSSVQAEKQIRAPRNCPQQPQSTEAVLCSLSTDITASSFLPCPCCQPCSHPQPFPPSFPKFCCSGSGPRAGTSGQGYSERTDPE